MKKNLPLIIVFCLINSWCFAQDYFQLSQFTQSAHGINPGFSGVEDYVDLTTGYRRQWANINGTPTTYYLGVSLSNLNFQRGEESGKSFRVSEPETIEGQITEEPLRMKHGFGLYILNNRQGPFTRNAGYVSYAFHYLLANGWAVSAGAAGSFINQRFDDLNATVYNPDLDEIYQAYALGRRTGNYMGLNAGITLSNNRFYVGYSAHNAASVAFTEEESDPNQISDLYHFLMAGVNYELNSEFSLHPSVLLKYSQGFSLLYDVNCKIQYRQLGWAGLTYRSNNDIAGMLGFIINRQINLGYSYDLSTSGIGRDNSGTHELVLSLMLGNKNDVLPVIY